MLNCVSGLYPVDVSSIPFPSYDNLKCLPMLPGTAPPPSHLQTGRSALLRTADLDQWLSSLERALESVKTQISGPP